MVTVWHRRAFQTAPTVTDLLVDAIVELGQTRNRLEISFDKRREPDAREQRPLAMILQSVHVLPFQPTDT
jgi:hypothetical protein